jgi:hypothetical protein
MGQKGDSARKFCIFRLMSSRFYQSNALHRISTGKQKGQKEQKLKKSSEFAFFALFAFFVSNPSFAMKHG